MQVLLATMNKGKVMELEELLNDEKIEILSLSDLPDYQEVEESGSTFAENAFIKARAACAAGKMITLADDSGLEVDALAGAPGIFSARYAGEPKNDEHNIEKLLTDLEGVPEENRTARFRCALAIICPDGQEYLTEGSVEGRILTERIGTGGFGYDPVFYLPDLQKTMAELSLDEKNCLSHRARAFAKAVPLLTALMKSF
ncbi:XTP/dITP diphosphatase [Dehalobacter sp. 12DCB1]|uniref:XTP/dITP diphosphatase n=1 Tax=unclassified Dehalobacter TaxID=2635733 RepID=UPI0002D6C057|nr:XTP/dITP diphosphatase [Dehalobacter sp. 12DCB1]TCX51081.1 XTP/dITP diphosphatase [Dehalobacter sp. 12DCB1]